VKYEVLKTSFFYSKTVQIKNPIKFNYNTLIVQLQEIKNLNYLIIKMLRFLSVLEVGIEPTLRRTGF
jgi:hypothetical protein